MKQNLKLQFEAKNDDYWYYNKKGKIRLNFVRTRLESMGALSHKELLKIYKEWRDSDEFMIIANAEKRQYRAIKCAKRGNDVYQWRVAQRFKELDELAEGMGFDRIFNISDHKPMTNVLMITLTYDSKRCSIGDAWHNIGSDWNRFTANLERKFGKISFVRAWEGYKSGYPHIHAVVYFQEHKFEVFEHRDTQNKSTYRIKAKENVVGKYHSYVDVKAVSSLGGSLRYITKYLRKQNLTGAGVNLTQAQMWLHRNQSFSVSSDFVKLCKTIRLDNKIRHNSNKPMTQTTVYGDKLKDEWTFVGIFPRYQLEPLVKDRKSFKTAWTASLTSLNGLKIEPRNNGRNY